MRGGLLPSAERPLMVLGLPVRANMRAARLSSSREPFEVSDVAKHVLHLSQDLMLGSTVSGLAASQGHQYQNVATVPEVKSICESQQGLLLLIDIALPGLDLTALAGVLPADVLANSVAYGPHVHREKLELARAVGFGSVISRGQFSSQVSQILAGS